MLAVAEVVEHLTLTLHTGSTASSVATTVDTQLTTPTPLLPLQVVAQVLAVQVKLLAYTV